MSPAFFRSASCVSLTSTVKARRQTKYAPVAGADGERPRGRALPVGERDRGGRHVLRHARDVEPATAVVEELQRRVGEPTVPHEAAVVGLELCEAGHHVGAVERAALGGADEGGRRGADALDGSDAAGNLLDVHSGVQ
jgi:hypothetical protein